jgi:hypothetical protein
MTYYVNAGERSTRKHRANRAEPRMRPPCWALRSDVCHHGQGRSLHAFPEGMPTFAVDRAALTNTIIASAIGGSLLVLVALGLWRWRSTLSKACPYCDAKMARTAHACRRFFRAV